MAFTSSIRKCGANCSCGCSKRLVWLWSCEKSIKSLYFGGGGGNYFEQRINKYNFEIGIMYFEGSNKIL